MKWAERQKKAEQKVYECIDEIADEFNLNVPYYPLVIWTGRKILPEFIGLPKSEISEYLEYKKNKRSYFLPRSNIIVLNDFKIRDIAEESAHAIHYAISGINSEVKRNEDYIFLNVLCEMLGFLGVKTVIPEVRSDYLVYPDIINSLDFNPSDILKKVSSLRGFDNVSPLEFFIYQQGYTLGEILFCEYIKGNILKEDIKIIFEEKIDIPGKAFSRFVNLRKRFWMPKKDNILNPKKTLSFKCG